MASTKGTQLALETITYLQLQVPCNRGPDWAMLKVVPCHPPPPFVVGLGHDSQFRRRFFVLGGGTNNMPAGGRGGGGARNIIKSSQKILCRQFLGCAPA